MKGLAIVYHYGSLDSWEPSTDCHVASIPGVQEAATVDLSPDGKWIAVADGRETVWIVDSVTLVVVGTLNYPSRINDIQFSPDSALLAGAASNGDVVLWEHKSAHSLRWFRSALDYRSVHGTQVVYLSHDVDNDVRILDFSDPAHLKDELVAANSPAEDLWWRYPGDDLVIGRATESRSADIVDLELRRRLGVLALDGASVIPFDRTADKRHLLLNLDHRGLLYWDNLDHRGLLYWDTKLGRPSLSYLNTGLFYHRLTPDRKRLVADSGFSSGKAQIVDLMTGLTVTELDAEAVDFSPGGETMFTRDSAGIVKAFDAGSMDLLETLGRYKVPSFARQRGWRKVVHYTPDWSTFLVPEKGGVIGIYDAQDLSWLGDLMERDAHFMHWDAEVMDWVAFSPDSTRCVSVLRHGRRQDHRAILWDIDRMTSLAKLDLGEGSVHGVAFSPDSSLLAVGRADGYVEIFGADDARFLMRFSVSNGEVSWLKFTPDGENLIFAADRKSDYPLLGIRKLRRESRSPSEIQRLVGEMTHE